MSTPRLTDVEIEAALASVPEWTRDGDAGEADQAITRCIVFRNFREVVSFLVLIAFDAEEADHHPDVTINYKRLTLRLSTHSEGGLTQKDFDLAKKIDDALPGATD